jgi:hypothetical protein
MEEEQEKMRLWVIVVLLLDLFLRTRDFNRKWVLQLLY